MRRCQWLLIAACLIGFCTGCGGVHRRFRVESNPPGAYVYVNNEPKGPTPVDVPFLFYGDYDIKLVKEGFQTKPVMQPVPTPWYEYPVLEFISEVLWPFEITDTRPLYFEMEPAIQPNLDELKAEGEELRNRGKALPPPRYPEERTDKKPAKPGRGEVLPPPRESLPAPKAMPEKAS